MWMNNASIAIYRETAPDFFMRNEEGGYSYVYKQPDSEEAINLCIEALEGCRLKPLETTAIKSKSAKFLG